MAAFARPDFSEKLPRRGAAISAAVVGLAWAALPTDWLEAVSAATGVAALLPLAAPPLGAGARAVMALGGGALTAILVWATLYSLFGEGGIFASGQDNGTPIVRRADAHPDAPPRRPLSVAELTRAIEPDEAADPGSAIEHAIPHDLNTPLSALDPGAIPAVPREPARSVTPLVPGERLKTFALTPPPPARPDAVAGVPNIDALLQRLGGGRAAV